MAWREPAVASWGPRGTCRRQGVGVGGPRGRHEGAGGRRWPLGPAEDLSEAGCRPTSAHARACASRPALPVGISLPLSSTSFGMPAQALALPWPSRSHLVPPASPAGTRLLSRPATVALLGPSISGPAFALLCLSFGF
eukprot:364201-Chlamydomonas_euryale.AAC.12